MNQELKDKVDEVSRSLEYLVHIAKLALTERNDDLRLYVARVVRKLRRTHPSVAQQLESLLKTRPALPPATPFRGGLSAPSRDLSQSMPTDEESRLSLFKVFEPTGSAVTPMLSGRVRFGLEQLISERRQIGHLADLGLEPSRSAMFVGQPGLGKTLTARWVAQQLGVQLLVLDLTAVMSSLLGRSGTNLRMALDYAKSRPCVLLLDEIDAIAKRRSDDADVGELKRLVTVILQEVDEWPSSGLLLAATNHPELIDPALWRRFDLVIEFEAPSRDDVLHAIQRFLGPEGLNLKKWINSLALLYRGESYSNIERDMNRLRRMLAIGGLNEEEVIRLLIRDRGESLPHSERIELAVDLVAVGGLSQHVASDLTGVSRDTIRKRTARKINN